MGTFMAPTNDIDSRKVELARDEAQNAAQWLARMTRSYAGDGHGPQGLHLFWDGATRTMTTPEIAPGVVLELQLPSLALQFIEAGKPSPHVLDVEGKSSTEIEAWLLVEMLHRGFERENFSKKLPYPWSKLMSGDEVKYMPEAHASELQHLTDWFADAAEILSRVKQRIPVGNGPQAALQSELICWPDCFQIGFIAQPHNGGGQIKVAFSTGHDGDTDPVFVVSRMSESRAGTPPVGMTLPIAEILRDRLSPDGVVQNLIKKVAEASG